MEETEKKIYLFLFQSRYRHTIHTLVGSASARCLRKNNNNRSVRECVCLYVCVCAVLCLCVSNQSPLTRIVHFAMGTVAILHPLALMLFVIVCVWFIRISRLSFVQFQLDVALKQSTSLEISFDFNQKLAIYLSFYKLLVKFIVYLNYSFDRKKIDKKRAWNRNENENKTISGSSQQQQPQTKYVHRNFVNTLRIMRLKCWLLFLIEWENGHGQNIITHYSYSSHIIVHWQPRYRCHSLRHHHLPLLKCIQNILVFSRMLHIKNGMESVRW